MNCTIYHVLVDSSVVAFGLVDRLEALEVAKSWLRCFPNANVILTHFNTIGGFSIDCL